MVKIVGPWDGILNYKPDLPPIPNANDFGKIVMDNEVNAYWNGMTERRFTISFWKVKRLVEKSNINHLALKLTNYKDPFEVDGEWVSLNVESGESSTESVNEEVIYYSLDKQLVIKFEEGFDDLSGDQKPEEEERTITARIGKVERQIEGETSYEHVIFFILGKNTFHIGTGQLGPSASCGAKIPPGQ